jgi:hypothetical protein
LIGNEIFPVVPHRQRINYAKLESTLKVSALCGFGEKLSQPAEQRPFGKQIVIMVIGAS